MLWWIAETTLVAAVLAAVAALAPRLRPLGPAARHALWLVVLIKLMTPPLLSWPWPVYTRPQPDGAARAPARALERVERARDDTQPTTVAVALGGGSPARPRWVPPDPSALGRWAAGVWLAVAATLAAGQLVRIVQFRRRLRGSVPAPAWLVGEAERAGQRLGVRVPEALVVPGLGTPLLWCLGRPKLLLPAGLISKLGADRWRGILVHELAHLRRGDPWVRRVAIVAEWVWWWNPLYWIARRRIDALAELACDAWVVWALPGDRIVYAETLFDICASLATAMTPYRNPAPALGVTSSGRFFEGRLTMILSDHVDCRLSLPGLFGAGLLMLLALPSWIVAETPGDRPIAASVEAPLVAQTALASGPQVALADLDDDADEPAKNEPLPKMVKRPKPKGKPLKRPTQPGGDTSPASDGKGKIKIEIDLSAVEKAFGPDSEFVENLEKLGQELEKAMAQKFGPGSEFETKMKELGQRMEEKFGPGSDFEKRTMKDKSKETGEAATPPAAKKKYPTRPSPKPVPRSSDRPGKLSREQRIKELESKIDALRDELKKLEANDGADDGPPPAGAVQGA